MNKFILIFSVFIIASCSNKEDKNLTKLTKERDELAKKIDVLNADLVKVNDQINLIQKVDKSTAISTHKVGYEPFEHTIDIQSNVSTDQDVMIMPEFAGTLNWKIKEGSRVSKGQVIGTINDGGMSQQLSAVKAQANLARTAFEKQERLWNEKIGSEIQYLQAKTQSEAASSQVSALQSQMSRTQVRAPFSGVIDHLIMQSGQSVAPGMPLGKIVNLGSMKVIADISEQYITKVKVGTLVNINIATINQNMQGKVARVSNSINPSNRTFSIEIPISNIGGLVKPNMSAKLNIIDYKNSNSITVPNDAILTNASGDKFVYTISNINGNKGKASKTLINIGQSNTQTTEVLSGLKIGDIVVKDGNKTVVDKSEVKF